MRARSSSPSSMPRTCRPASTKRSPKAKKAEETAAADEARYRENVTALKGSDGAKRFVDELNHAEDQLQATRKQIADLEAQKAAATDKLDQVISALSYDWNETETK